MHTLSLRRGTFDPIPPHGHLITCQRAREILSADRVLFIPAHISPHKTHRRSASADHRLAMLHAAIADHAFFLADARELDRGETQGRPSYTIETIESLRHENPADRFTLLIGSDQLPNLHTWHRIGELVDMIDLAILARPTSPQPAAQHSPESAPKPSQTVPKPPQNVPESVQNQLPHPPINPISPPNPVDAGLQIVAENLGPIVANRLKQRILHTPLIEISSTDIRERIRENLPLDFLLPPSVIAYIQLHNLYKND